MVEGERGSAALNPENAKKKSEAKKEKIPATAALL